MHRAKQFCSGKGIEPNSKTDFIAPEGRPEHVISQQPKIVYVGNGPSTAILGTV